MIRQDSVAPNSGTPTWKRIRGLTFAFILACLGVRSALAEPIPPQASAQGTNRDLTWVLTTADGQEQTVSALKLSPSRLQFADGSATQSIDIKNVRSIHSDRPSVASSLGEGEFKLGLSDGTIVRGNSIQLEDSLLRSGQQIEIPVSAVQSLRYGPLSEEQSKQWSDYAQAELSSDLLVIKQSSGALTKIDGIVNAISTEAVEFEFSGQTIPVPLAKVAALRFYSNVSPSDSAAGFAKDRLGNQYAISSVASSETGDLLLSLAGGGRCRLALSDLARIDFGLGNSKYLTEVPFEVAAEPSQLSVALSGLGTVSTGRVRVVPASKLPGSAQGPCLEVLGECRVTFSSLGSFTKLTGGVRMIAKNSFSTPCRIEILLESKTVWETVLKDGEDLERFEIPIPPDNRLTLRVSPLDKYAVGTHIQWLEPQLAK